MKSIRALIIDDERLARRELLRLLKGFPEIAVVGEAANADEAAERIAALSPDLLFLDIQMPGRDGFELLASLDHLPRVIFTTAHDDFALRAFEVSALDYLLKPIEPRRLAAAIARATADEHRSGPSSSLTADDRIFIRDGERCWFVRISEIVLLESEGNYTRVHFGDEKPLIHRSLNYLESRLDPRDFFRANRSQIINVHYIDTIAPSLGDGLNVRLVRGVVVEMSRRQSQRFREVRSL